MQLAASQKERRLPKMAAILGGFLILAGIVLLGMTALAISGFLDADILLKNKYLFAFATLMIMVGLFDTVAAVIIARW